MIIMVITFQQGISKIDAESTVDLYINKAWSDQTTFTINYEISSEVLGKKNVMSNEEKHTCNDDDDDDDEHKTCDKK